MTGLHFLDSSIQSRLANHQLLLSPVYTSISMWLLLGLSEPLLWIMAYGSWSQSSWAQITTQQLYDPGHIISLSVKWEWLYLPYRVVERLSSIIRVECILHGKLIWRIFIIFISFFFNYFKCCAYLSFKVRISDLGSLEK